MANIILAMFVADVIFVFIGSCVFIVSCLWKLVHNQYAKMTGQDTSNAKPEGKPRMKVREKATQGVFDVVETRKGENGKTEYKIYKDDDYIWVSIKDYIPFNVR